MKYYLELSNGMSLASDNDIYGKMIECVRAAANHLVNVMLIGDPGSGKELVADAIHQCGIQSQGPLVKVNCAALPGLLLESELFGHVKGAFTGAIADRKGKFAAAAGGTIFLDEICHIDTELQAKLLRTVEYGDFTPVGGDLVERSTARIIVAFNEDISSVLAERRFRHDLFYRLASYIIQVPCLRERPEDIAHLVTYFFKQICMPLGIECLREDARDLLVAYHWPGNIRELRAVMQAGAINAAHRASRELTLGDLNVFPSRLAEQRVDTGTVPDNVSSAFDAIRSGKMTLNEAELAYRKDMLTHIRTILNGDTAEIAALLGMSQSATRALYSRSGLSVGRRAGATTGH